MGAILSEILDFGVALERRLAILIREIHPRESALCVRDAGRVLSEEHPPRQGIVNTTAVPVDPLELSAFSFGDSSRAIRP